MEDGVLDVGQVSVTLPSKPENLDTSVSLAHLDPNPHHSASGNGESMSTRARRRGAQASRRSSNIKSGLTWTFILTSTGTRSFGATRGEATGSASDYPSSA